MSAIELRAVFVRAIKMFNESAGIFEFSVDGKKVSAIGDGTPDDFEENLTYLLYGKWAKYKDCEQFRFSTFVRSRPHGEQSIIAYISKAPGIGPRIAKILWDKFQSDAVRIIRESPEICCAAVPGGRLTQEKAIAAATFLSSQMAIEDCTIDLIGLFDKSGIRKSAVKSSIAAWGNMAADIIRRNPYVLMRFSGCGFATCDKMYCSLQLPQDRLKRIAYAAYHSLYKDRTGNVWIPAKEIEIAVTRHIGAGIINDEKLARGIELAIRGKMISVTDIDGVKHYALQSLANDEMALACSIVRIATDGDPKWPHASTVEGISDHQFSALSNLLKSKICILSGKPGTGKTYTAARLIKSCVSHFGFYAVAVVAPTNKAAERISEVMESHGVKVNARTIHSLLGVMKGPSGFEFSHGEGSRLSDLQYLFVDEASMPDLPTMRALFDAVPSDAHICLCGDIRQLPPVGQGAPLRDMIEAGVMFEELTEVRRQDSSSTIVSCCNSIIDDAVIVCDKQFDFESGKNLVFREARTDAACLSLVVNAVTAIRDNGVVDDPIEDVQVIVPVNEKSECSRVAVNKQIQNILNANGEKIVGTEWRKGDKIISNGNGLFSLVDSDGFSLGTEEFIAKGRQGRVMFSHEKSVVVRFGKKLVRIPVTVAKKDDDEGNDEDGREAMFDLAYAVTCHKSQGSEWKIVIVVCDPSSGASRLMCREWVYTAVSRAKTACLMIGIKMVTEGALKKVLIRDRKTMLAERIYQQAVLAAK